MLPIDEHAKSGAWVYCTNLTLQEFQKVRWQSGVWVNASGFGGALEEAYTHYLPASWVENARAVAPLVEAGHKVLNAHTVEASGYALDDLTKALAPFQQEVNHDH